MTKTVTQSVVFKGVSAQTLYETYMTAAKHSAAVGMPVSLEPKVGGRFKAFGGMLTGRFLALVKDQLIIQEWRSVKFKKTDGDSILVLRFEKTKAGARVDLVHGLIPGHDYIGIQKGWPRHYWKPWAKYFKASKRTK
jgi:activator of HSP90 ATPase